MMEVWSSLFDRGLGDYRFPRLKNIRLLIDRELFEHYTGWVLSEEMKWAEPVSRGTDREFLKWAADRSGKLLSQVGRADAYIEGCLAIEDGPGGKRYSINGHALSYGTEVEIRFGGIWIPGTFSPGTFSFGSSDEVYVRSGEDRGKKYAYRKSEKDGFPRPLRV